MFQTLIKILIAPSLLSLCHFAWSNVVTRQGVFLNAVTKSVAILGGVIEDPISTPYKEAHSILSSKRLKDHFCLRDESF